MALYLKRLKVKRTNVGATDIIFNPITVAQIVFNPALRYLDEQYSSIVPRETLTSLVTRDNEELSIEEDIEDTEENLLNSTEYWWNVDYISEIQRTSARFNQIVKGIKDGTLQRTDELVNELSLVCKECAFALRNEYLKYCLFYESLFILEGYQPEKWWLLTNDLNYDSRSFYSGNKTIKIAGHTIQSWDGRWTEWEDKPYEWDVSWTAWLNPFNWGKDEYDIRRERQTSKWKNFLKHLRDEGSDLTRIDGEEAFMINHMPGDEAFKIINSITLMR